MKKCGKTIIKYGLPALCVLVLGCIILAIQGIWPFGSESIDYYDMAQQLAAEYIQVYDELHFDKSMFFDWYLNLGRGIPGGTYIALSNLLFYLFPRDAILYAFSILFLVKIMAMAVTMRILLEKEAFSCPELFKVVLATGYGLCGYVLMQYTIISWLDVAMLAPLVVLYTKKSLKEGKVIGLSVCLTLSLLVSFAVPAMMLIFIFMIAGLYIVCDFIFEKKIKLHVFRLGMAVASGLAFSAWSWIPKVKLSAGGFRYELESSETTISKYLKILRHVQPDYSIRWWALLGVSFAAAVTVIGIIFDIKKENTKRLFFSCGTLLISLIQLLLENIQLFWHFGSYVNYPVRNGFAMYIVFALLAATYLPEIINIDAENTLGKTSKLVLYLLLALITAVLAGFGIGWYKANYGMSIYTVFRTTMLCVIGTFFVYLFIIAFKHGKFVFLSPVVIVAELIFYGVLLIGKPIYVTGYAEEVEQEGEYIRIANELKTTLAIEDSDIDRIKNPDETLNANYGLFLKRPTLSGWTTFATSDSISVSAKKGYSVQYTRLLDAGGDVLSDALYHTTQILSCVPQSDELYRKVSSAKTIVNHQTGAMQEYSLYDCRYVLPFGNVAGSKELLDEITNAGIDDYDNAVVRALGFDDEKFANSTVREVLYSGLCEDSLTVDIKGNKALYFCGTMPDSETKDLKIFVNDKAVNVPSLKEPENTLYSAHFNNGNLLLGCFKDEEVLIEFEKTVNENSFEHNYSIFTIDLDLLNEFCEYSLSDEGTFETGKSGLDATVTGKDGSFLLLPILYDDGWSATVNGVKAEIVKVDDFLMAIPLNEGENAVCMRFFPKEMKLWIFVSVISFIVFAALCLACSKGHALIKADLESKIDRILGIAYCIGWCATVTVFMIIPAVYGLIYYIKAII